MRNFKNNYKKKLKLKEKQEKRVLVKVPEDVKKSSEYLEAKKEIKKGTLKLNKQASYLKRKNYPFSEFLSSKHYDFLTNSSYYEKRPVFRYLPDVFLSFLKSYFESLHSEFHNLSKLNETSSKVMLSQLLDKKKEEARYVKRLYNTHGLDLKYKHVFKRLYKKLRTNFGYRRFNNLIASESILDKVRVPVKEIEPIESRYVLKKTIAKIPVAMHSMHRFLSAALSLQNLIIEKTKEAYTEKTEIVTKSSIFKHLNQWIRIAKRIPGVFSKSTRNPGFSFKKRISFRNRVPLKDYLTYVFFRGFFKSFVKSIRHIYRPSPGKVAFLERRKFRFLRKFLIYKNDLSLLNLPTEDDKSLYASKLKTFMNIGFWADTLSYTNRISFNKFINQRATDGVKGFLGFQTSEALDALKRKPKSEFLGKFISELLANPRALFRVLTKTSLNAIALLSPIRFRKFKSEKQRIRTNMRSFYQHLKKPQRGRGFFRKYKYPQFLSGRRRLLAYEEVGIFQNLMSLISRGRPEKKDFMDYFKSFKATIKRKFLYFKRASKTKRDYRTGQHYFKRSRRRLPAFRIILRQSANNFFVTATVNYGSKVVNNFTSGLVGLTGPSRSTGYAASQVGRAVGSTLTKMNFGPSLCVFRSPITSKLRNLAKGIIFNFHLIKGFYDLIPRSHNGLRLPKPRRL